MVLEVLAEEILDGKFYPLDEVDEWVRRRPDEFTPCFRSLWAWYRDQEMKKTARGSDDDHVVQPGR